MDKDLRFMLTSDRSKALFLLIACLVATSLNFWLTSRYPDLGTKSALGGDAPLSGLGFGPLYPISPTFTIYEKLFYGTINWLDTNRRGMTFSFILGAFLLSFLPLVDVKKFKSSFGNALFGVILGTPLGLCVNCTAPIARSMQVCGMGLETALAFLVSSPTLNVVILTMVFALFPLYLALYKIFFTLLFVLFIIPLACKTLFKRELSLHNARAGACVTGPGVSPPEITGGWLGAVKWCLVAYVKNLIRILILTGPLMVLAGFLGTLIITLVPWEDIRGFSDSLPASNVFALMLGIAFIGALLPAPMAFDVAMSSALLQAGVPMIYVSVLLFTLGSYSIYAFMIVWQAVSLRMASFLLVVTVLLGLLTGVSTVYLERYYTEKAKNIVDALPVNVQSDPYLDPILQRSDEALDFSAIAQELGKNKVIYRPVGLADGLNIEATPLKSQENKGFSKAPFTRAYGEALGMLQPYRVSYLSGLDMIPRLTSSIAAGDVHDDGWEDVLVLGDHETTPNLILFANIGGKKFIRQSLPPAEDVVLVALADLNGDGWLDIVYATYAGENFVIYNNGGEFREENRKLISSVSPATTNSIGFGDVDKNGSLDILTGNWSVGTLFINEPSSGDYVLKSENGGYVPYPLPGLKGETLTSLIWDFNGDSTPDLYLGNDYIVGSRSDLILLGDGKGDFSLTSSEFTASFPGAQSTMSIDVADIDNDLSPEFFLGQIAYIGDYMRAMSKIAEKQISFNDFCFRDGLPPERIHACREETEFKVALAKVTNFVVDACEAVQNTNYREMCEIHLSNYLDHCAPSIYEDRPVFAFKEIKASPRYAEFCVRLRTAANNPANRQFDHTIMSHHLASANISLGNILLDDDQNDGQYKDVAKQRGVAFGGWTWNAKFADLDNDGWQDLYVVNGYVRATVAETKIFYRNKGDGSFQDATNSFGLEDYSPTSAYTYVDFDHDGDLDIISVPVDGPIKIFNNTPAMLTANSVQFILRDEATANTSAIGAKIKIRYLQDGKPMQQIGFVKGSGGYKSFDPALVHFGLGSARVIETVDIEWPDGERRSLKMNIDANMRYKIRRPAH